MYCWIRCLLPGYHRFSRIYHANDLQWRYVEIDEDGIVIDSLKHTQLKWAAAGNGIQISCLSEYCESDKDKYAHILIVNYSDLEEKDFRTAVEVLSQIIS